MPALAEIKTSDSGDSRYRNFVVIPGFAGGKLSDATCPHFNEWLDRILGLCATSARSWVFDHDIRLQDLESWDKYGTTGAALLEQLLVLVQEKLDEEETIILIGHKLGCYILKKALIEAYHNEYKDEYRQLLDMIETIMLVGEPSLNPKKPDEWINLISECVSRQRGLPKRLGNGDTVGCLQDIADTFERILLHSTLLDVSGGNAPQPKRKLFRVKKLEHDGCIGCATIHIRLFTTSSEETIMDTGPGDPNICPFHPKSVHFRQLLMLKSSPELPQLEAPPENTAPIFSAVTTTHSSRSEAGIVPAVVAQASRTVDMGDTNGDLSENSELPPQQQLDHAQAEIEEIEGPSQPQQTEDESINVLSQDDDVDIMSQEGNALSSQTSIEEISVDRRETPATWASASSAVGQSQPHNESPRERRKCFSSSIPSRDSKFFGRSEILGQLERTILRAGEYGGDQTWVQTKQATLVWLSAGPGMGKTAIAAEFAHRFMEDFEYVIWLNASSNASLGRHCHDAAVALGLVNERTSQDHALSTSKLMEKLKDATSPWLLVLDDCTDGVDLTNYLPSNDLCSIIATGRRQPQSDGWTTIDVPPFTSEEAAKLLLSCVEGHLSEKDVKGVQSAAERYHFSPLTIRQLAKWSTRDTFSFKDISDLLTGEDMRLSFRIHDPHDVLSCTMNKLDKPATSLLVTLSFHDPHRISKRLLRTVKLPQSWKISRLDTESTLTNATALLWRSAFLDVDGSQPDSTYQMHKSVQDWIRGQVDDETWRGGFESACSNLKYQWPSRRKLKNIMGGFWEDFDNVHTHVHHLAYCLTRDRLVDQFSYDPGDEFKKLLVYHTWYNSRRGNHAEDRDLRNLTEFLLTTTVNRRRDKEDGAIESHPCLPSRCIMVTDDDNNPTAKLVETDGDRAPYIALSYVWGSDSSNFRLRSSNLNKYKERIDMSVCPQQISDAIRFTRNMKVKYLWVDALCIVQDNPAEVSKELEQMVQYYSDCSMVICDLKPRTSFSHLKWEPSQRLDIPPYSILRSRTLRSTRSETTWNRAWVLQEKCFRSSSSQKNIRGTIDASHDEDLVSSYWTANKVDLCESCVKTKTKDDMQQQASHDANRDTAKDATTEPVKGTCEEDPKESDPSPKAVGASDLGQALEPELRFEERLAHSVTAMILSTGGFTRRTVSIVAKEMQLVIRWGKENPWVICCLLCICFSLFSYCLGAHMARSGESVR